MKLPNHRMAYDMEGYTLRALTRADVAQMLSLQDEVMSALPNPRWYFPSDEREFADAVDAREAFGYFRSGELCGFAEISDGLNRGARGYAANLLEPVAGSFDFHDVMVRPDHRGLGMHTRFLRLFQQMARNEGGHAIYATVDPENAASWRNFEKAGYLPVAVKPAYDGRPRRYYRQDPRIVTTDAADPRFVALCAELDTALNAAVGAQKQRATYDALNTLNGLGVTALALVGETAVGCAAIKPCDAESAELKRVYIRESYCGQGLAHAMIARLEQAARMDGYRRMILETGRPLQNAIRLYRGMGYSATDNYGPYAGVAESLCMEKSLEAPFA